MLFVLLVGLGSYVDWFVSGKPVVTDEYLVKYNQLGQGQLSAADNAWPEYEKAVSLFVEPNETVKGVSAFKAPDFASMSDVERQAIVAWVTANESAWTHYQKAGHKAGYHRPLHYDRGLESTPPLIGMTSNSSLMRLRRLAEIGLWKARLAAEEERVGESIDNCLVVARAGASLQTSIGLLDQVVGIGLGAAARSELLRMATKYDLSEDTLYHVQMTLEELYPDGFPLANLEGEHLVVLDAVQHSFTQGGPGGGHIIPGHFSYCIVASRELPEGARTTAWAQMTFGLFDVALSMMHARRDETVAKINEVYDEVLERSTLSPCQRHLVGKRDIAESVDLYRYGFVYMFLPDEGRVSELAFQFRVDHEATLTVLALERFRTERGTYPADLKDLVDARYLERVPMDASSSGPLIYRRTDDEFLLYSVGRDFVDDGGERGVDGEGRPKVWGETGERVFWPVMRVAD